MSRAEIPQGIHRHGGRIFRVEVVRGSPRVSYLTKQLKIDRGKKDYIWQYAPAPGAHRLLSKETLLPLEDALAEGIKHHMCIWCCRPVLRDKGIGPVCTNKLSPKEKK